MGVAPAQRRTAESREAAGSAQILSRGRPCSWSRRRCSSRSATFAVSPVSTASSLASSFRMRWRCARSARPTSPPKTTTTDPRSANQSRFLSITRTPIGWPCGRRSASGDSRPVEAFASVRGPACSVPGAVAQICIGSRADGTLGVTWLRADRSNAQSGITSAVMITARRFLRRFALRSLFNSPSRPFANPTYA